MAVAILCFLNNIFTFKGIFPAGAAEMDAPVPDPQGIRSGTVAAMQRKGGTYMLICPIPSPKSLCSLGDACKQ